MRIVNKLKQQNFKVRLIATTIVIFLLSIFVVSLLDTLAIYT